MKSRRDQLGPFTGSDVATFLRELWERADASPVPANVLLLLERGVRELNLEPGVARPLTGDRALPRFIDKTGLANRWVARTAIMLAATPSESSIGLIARRLGCAPVMASVYFAAVADRVGRLSDDNGERAPGGFLSLSASDIDSDIERLAGVISATDLDTAFRRGLCEPVDFLTPLDGANLYLGVDIQPGHLAAGLLAERPEARARVLDALEQSRAVLIAGPSGSGKSGLMWEVARNSRHTVRWFRVRGALAADAVELLRLADGFRATAHTPIGFVMDDVGRTRSELWDALAAEAATRPNVVLLGSIREEDVFLVTRRSLVTEIRELPDGGLAERIWRELRSRNQTDWPGWREPWQSCNGLLLEYTHLLTQGRRLWSVLKEQVDRRAREERGNELAVLRLTSAAGSAGAKVRRAWLGRTLDISENNLSDALRRLIDEHLVQSLGDERLGSLHQIRAAAIAQITHEYPPPEIQETIRQAAACVDGQDLEAFVARTLATDPELTDAIMCGIVDRISREPSLECVTSVLRGLDAASIGDTVERWLPEVARLGIRPAHATTVAMFALAKTAPFAEGKLQALFEAAAKLRTVVHKEHRQALMERVESQLSALLPDPPDWRGVTGLLAGLVGASPLPYAVELRLAQLLPDLLAMPLADVIELLECANCVAPAMARAWISRVGQEMLLDRLASELAWTSSASLRVESEGLAACADVLHVSDRLPGDLHGQVVELCRKLLALAPSADLAVSSAIAPDGRPVGIGHPIASKRIPRVNLPPVVETTRNRRWLAAVAQRVAPIGLSRYLAEAKELLDALVPPLRGLIDGVIRGSAREKYLESIGRVHTGAQSLSRPPDPEELEGTVAVGVSDLQSVLDFCSTSLVRGLIELPYRAAASYSLTADALGRIDRVSACEPWVLLGDGPPSSLAQLREIVEHSLSILGEAGARGLKPSRLCPQVVNSTRSTKALARLASWVERQIQARLERLNKAVECVLREQGYDGRVAMQRIHAIGGTWPYAEVLVVVTLEQLDDWFPALVALAEPLRAACGDGRRIAIVPALGGFSVPDLGVAGVKTLLPLLTADGPRLEGLGFPPARLPLTRYFDQFAAGLLEVSAIEAFGCAVEGRSPKERSALEEAIQGLKAARSELERSLPDATRAELASLLDELQALGPDLAKEQWICMHNGELTEVAVALTAVKLKVIAADFSSRQL